MPTAGSTAQNSSATGPTPPLVSVIIRSMGRHTLREALDSVVRQNYPALEIVVVDALGSGHPSLPCQYGDIPLSLCGTGQRLARSRAANLGMAQARGQYLIFLDDDDWFEPSHINALVKGLRERPHARVAYAGVQCLHFDSQGNSQPILEYNAPFNSIRILFENFIPIHAVLFDKSLYEAGCHFDEDLNLYEDWDFWLQLRERGTFIHVDQISAIYRIDAANNLGSTANKGLLPDGVLRIINKWRSHWTDHEISRLFDYARKGVTTAGNNENSPKQNIDHPEPPLPAEISKLHEKIALLTTQLQVSMTQLDTVTARLNAIETSSIWRFSYPYRYLMSRLRALLHNRRPKSIPAPPQTVRPAGNREPNPHPVDIIVPVYKGLEETRQCLESLLAAENKTHQEIIVIDDASPEPALVEYLQELAQDGKITILHNTENLGFVLTCNRGMALHSERDVVLLNSDTQVANDWLDRLAACAYRDSPIGTVTPFSNNATICSYPIFCADNALPRDCSPWQMDDLFRRLNSGQALDIPTAVGFCMYIRRDCLTEVGYFDTEHFGKGYGEENDFSLRAQALGWRNVLCADTFVYHTGGVSFADQQNEKKDRAMAKLKRIHPEYWPRVLSHIEQDPARPLRLSVDLARIAASELPNLLFITGDSPEDFLATLDGPTRSLLDTAQVFLLHPDDSRQQIVSWLREGEAFRLYFGWPADRSALQSFLRGLNIGRLHFHAIAGLDPLLYQLPGQLGLSQEGAARNRASGSEREHPLIDWLPLLRIHAYPRPDASARTAAETPPNRSRFLEKFRRLTPRGARSA